MPAWLQSKLLASPDHLVISCLRMRGKEMLRPEHVLSVGHLLGSTWPQVLPPSTKNQYNSIKTLKCFHLIIVMCLDTVFFSVQFWVC